MAKKKTPDIAPAAPEKQVVAPRRRAATKKTSSETVIEATHANNGSNGADSTPTPVSAADAPARERPSYDQIAEAAYLRYLNRGGSDGRDFDDWVAAEQELKTR
jgi:hypothetical protein